MNLKYHSPHAANEPNPRSTHPACQLPPANSRRSHDRRRLQAPLVTTEVNSPAMKFKYFLCLPCLAIMLLLTGKLSAQSAGPAITSALNAMGNQGVDFCYQIAAVTTSPTGYTASGLPAGLSLNPSTGLISGTPTATGTSKVTISASYAGGTINDTLTIKVLPTPQGMNMPIAEVVSCAVTDRQDFQIPDRVQLSGSGMIGSRILANETNLLVQKDLDRLLVSFKNRPDITGAIGYDGEHVGKWLHAATLAWVNTGDPVLRQKLDYVATELLACQLPNGYLGTYLPAHYWDGWDVWSHKYNLIGLITYMRYTGNTTPLLACQAIGDLLCKTFGTGQGQLDIIHSPYYSFGMAPGSVLEPMVLLYRLTGQQSYLDFCNYILRAYEEPGGPKIVSTLLAGGGVNTIGNGKAYEMLSCINGILEMYRTTGDATLLQAATNAWQDIVNKRLYLTGGASVYEGFSTDFNLPNTNNICETCVTVSWLQFNAQLLRLTGKAQYAEQLEKTVINQLLGAQKPDGSAWGYYVQHEGKKPYTKVQDGCCCLSSGPRGVALIPTFSQSVDADGVVVNLYNSGTANLTLRSGSPVALTTATAYPSDSKIDITVNTESTAPFALKARIPDWCNVWTAKVNGNLVTPTVGADGYATINRVWANGDTVELDLTLTPRVIAGDHLNAGKVAVMYGPLVLAADEALLGGTQKVSGVGTIANPSVTALGITPQPAPAYDKNWPQARVFHINAVQREVTLTGTMGAPIGVQLIPFADAGGLGAFGQAGTNRYRVWLPTSAIPPSLLLGGIESRSRQGNMLGSINDDLDSGWTVTWDNTLQTQDWYAVTLASPAKIGWVVFKQGWAGIDGGWFDTSGSNGQPQVQVQLTPGGAWETKGVLSDYPATTATNNRGLLVNQPFNCQFAQPLQAYGVRVIGVPASGIYPAQAYSSCSELQAFGSCPFYAWSNDSGDFLWSTSSLNWSGTTWKPGDSASFNLTGTGTITVSGTQIVGTDNGALSTPAITFDAPGHILTGGTLALPGSSVNSGSNSTITMNANAEIDSLINVGTGTINITGTATLTLSPGAGNTDTVKCLNLYGGNVSVNSGTLSITENTGLRVGASYLPVAAGLTVAGGAVNTTGAVFIQNGVLTVASGTYTHGGGPVVNAYSGTGAVNMNGGLFDLNWSLWVCNYGVGTVNLNGGTFISYGFYDQSGSGTVNFNGATVRPKDSRTTFTQTSTTSYYVQSGNAIFDTAGFDITVSANLLAGSPSGGLTKKGAGALTLTGTNTYNGLTTVTAGTLQLDGSTAGNLLVQAGARLTGNGTIGQNLTVASGGVAQLNGDTFALNGSITNNGLIILSISNGSQFTGAGTSFVNNGTLTIITDGTFVPPPGFQNNGVITMRLSAPVISSTLSESGTQGAAFNYQIAATNSPTSFGASNLPAGLNVNTTTGLISGTPTATGTTTVTISASNAEGAGTNTLVITVTRAMLAPTFINTGSDTFVASAVVTAAPYNADSTGVTDATGAIQKAINAVGALNGGVVYLPAGKYRLNGSLGLPYGVTLAGANNGNAETLLLAYYGQGHPDTAPLINSWGGETGIIGLSFFYPAQNPAAPVPYAATIGGVFIATVDHVTLYNSYHGIVPMYFNAICISNVKGTVLSAGIMGNMSSEFSWMHDVTFSPNIWINAAAALTGSAMPPGDQAALTAYVAANCTGLEFERIDGIAIMRYSAEGSKIPVRLRPNPQYDNGANGFGAVVCGWPTARKEVSWDPWYYGMHYVNLDQVPEASGSTYAFAATPMPPKLDAGSFFNVTCAPYNAAGDGVVDDTAAIANALSDAATHGGGTVYLPQGKYKLTSPLTIPTGVELRGAMGTGKIRESLECCTLYACCGQGAANPTTDTALITLAAGSGVRGFSIAYPQQAYDVSQLVNYPYAIRGAGANVWVVDMMIVNACYGIDLATVQCDNHLVRGLWGTAYYKGLAVGGGSVNGVLEHICFSFGPVESWPMAQSSYNPALEAFWETNCTAYQFGGAVGEKTWGLDSFDPNLHFEFAATGGGMQHAEFWQTMHDVGHRANILCDGGSDIKFFGYFGTGSGRGVYNWLEVAGSFAGPISFYGKAIQQTFINHPYDFTSAQVAFHDELSLTEGKAVSASGGSNPSNVADRNPSTLWIAPSGNTLTIDLGAVKMINRFAIENAGLFLPENLNTTVAQLNVSIDGVSFVKAGNCDNGTYPRAWYDVPIAPIQARYVQLAVTGAGADGSIRVASLQVFEDTFPEPIVEWRNNSGSFLWDASSLNWAGAAWAPGNSAVFGATGVGTINVRGTPIVGTDNGSLSTPAITFNTPGYKLTGGALSLPGSSANSGSHSTIAMNADAEIDSLINVGAGSFNLTGTAMLTLSPGAGNTDTLGALNLYGGGVSFNSGCVAMSSLVNYASSIVNFNGGTVKATSNNNSYISPGSGTLSCFVQSGSAIFDTAGFDVTVSASLLAGSPSGGLTKNGAGALTLAAYNNYTGPTTINAGTVIVGWWGSIYGSSVVNILGGSLDLNGQGTVAGYPIITPISLQGGALQNGMVTYSGGNFNIECGMEASNAVLADRSAQWSGYAAGLIKTTANTAILAGSNTYTGLTSINAGTLQLDGSIVGNLTVQAGGRLTGSGTIGGNLSVASGGVAQFNGATFAVNGVITNNGLVILSNGAHFTGTSSSFVNNGTLDIITAGAFTPPPGFQNRGVIIDSSAVRVTSVAKSGSSVTVRINSNTGHVYQLQYSPTLNGGTFANIGVPQTGATGATLVFSDPAARGSSGFYRVVVAP